MDRGLEGTKLKIHRPGKKEPIEFTGDKLKSLVEILEEMEESLVILERRGYSIAKLIERMKDGKLPVFRVFALLAAVLSLVACMMIFSSAGNDFINRLGHLTRWSTGLFLTTLAFAVATILGAWSAATGPLSAAISLRREAMMRRSILVSGR